MATVSTLEGKTFILLNPAAIAAFMRSPSGPVMRQMLVLGEAVKVEMTKLAPVRTGNLRDHIVKRIADGGPSGPVVLVGVENVPYAGWVVHGTAPHDIYPVNGKILAWQSDHGPGASLEREMTGDWHFAAHVHHPGTKPNNFMQQSLRVINLH